MSSHGTQLLYCFLDLPKHMLGTPKNFNTQFLYLFHKPPKAGSWSSNVSHTDWNDADPVQFWAHDSLVWGVNIKIKSRLVFFFSFVTSSFGCVNTKSNDSWASLPYYMVASQIEKIDYQGWKRQFPITMKAELWNTPKLNPALNNCSYLSISLHFSTQLGM